MNPFVEIHNIFEHYETAPNKKELDKRLRELGSMIEKRTRSDREKKIKAILQKGRDMTKSDIEYLIGNEVPHRMIRKHIGLGNTDFYRYLKINGLSKSNYTSWSDKEIEIVKKAVAEDEKITETAFKLKGRSYNAVATLRSEIKRGLR